MFSDFRIIRRALAAASLGFIACTVLRPGLVHEENLAAHADGMAVSGLSTFTFHRVVTFGTYRTGKLNLIWSATKKQEQDSKSWPFNSDFDSSLESKSHFAFKLQNSAGDSVLVSCAAFYDATVTHYSRSLSTEDVKRDGYAIRLRQGDSDFTATLARDGEIASGRPGGGVAPQAEFILHAPVTKQSRRAPGPSAISY